MSNAAIRKEEVTNALANTQFLSPIIKAAEEIFSIQADLQIKSLPPTIKNANEPLYYDVVSVLSLVCYKIEGSFILGFSEDVFLKICENMLGEPHTEITKDIEDAAGELLNIIYGMAKAELNDKQGYRLEKAIPTVIKGPNIKIKQSKGPIVVLPFESPFGVFHIEVEVVEKEED